MSAWELDGQQILVHLFHLTLRGKNAQQTSLKPIVGSCLYEILQSVLSLTLAQNNPNCICRLWYIKTNILLFDHVTKRTKALVFPVFVVWLNDGVVLGKTEKRHICVQVFSCLWKRSYNQNRWQLTLASLGCFPCFSSWLTSLWSF